MEEEGNSSHCVCSGKPLATHQLPSLPLLFSYPNGNCLSLPSQIHVHPCAVSHGYVLGVADSEKLPSQLMCLESCAAFNGLSQQCNCKCCMLTCALMVAPARLLGVLVGHFLVRWKRLVVLDKWGRGRCNLLAAG